MKRFEWKVLAIGAVIYQLCIFCIPIILTALFGITGLTRAQELLNDEYFGFDLPIMMLTMLITGYYMGRYTKRQAKWNQAVLLGMIFSILTLAATIALIGDPEGGPVIPYIGYSFMMPVMTYCGDRLAAMERRRMEAMRAS